MDQNNNNISWRDVGRKLFFFLCGMQFSLILLTIIVAACVAGSVLPQQAAESTYTTLYGTAGAKAILALQLNDVFHCGWFVVLAALLCLNLLLCSVLRFPQVWNKWRGSYTLEKRLINKDASFSLPAPEGVQLDLTRLGYKDAGYKITPEVVHEATDYQYARRNTYGVWGSWLCHLGMLLVIVGFAAGQALSQEWVVYGIPGSTQPIGDSGYFLTIDDFEVALREDYTVEQYTATLTVGNMTTAETVHGTASVNHPLSAFGMSLYQDSTGWANYVDITCDGDLVKQDLICAGELTYPDQLPTLMLQLNKFYPDFVQTADGSLYTATPICNNPYALYSLYYQRQMLAMNVVPMGQEIVVDRFGFTLRDPVQYTLIVIKTDPTAWFVALAALVMLAGILLAFYCRPYELWTDGNTLWARAEKAPGLLEDELKAKLKRLHNT